MRDRLKLLLPTVAICLALSGCLSARREAPVLAPLREVPQVVKQPDPAPVETRPVVFGSATVNGQSVLTLDAPNAENLRLNWAEVERWIKEAKERLNYYGERAAQ